VRKEMAILLLALFISMGLSAAARSAGDDPRMEHLAVIRADVCDQYGCVETVIAGPYVIEAYGLVTDPIVTMKELSLKECNSYLARKDTFVRVLAEIIKRHHENVTIKKVSCVLSEERRI